MYQVVLPAHSVTKVLAVWDRFRYVRLLTVLAHSLEVIGVAKGCFETVNPSSRRDQLA